MKKIKLLGFYVAVIVLILASMSCLLVTGSPPSDEPDISEDKPELVEPDLPDLPEVEVDEPEDEPEVTAPEPPPEPVVDVPGVETFSVPDGELGVSRITAYQDEWESWIIVGLVMNNTDRAADSLEIEVEVLDDAGDSIFSEVAYASLYSLAPGESSPFILWVWDEMENPAEFVGEVVGFSTTDLERADVDIIGDMMTFGEGYVNVTGEIVNNNDFPVDIADLAAATFDTDGNLMTADSDDVAISYLQPGDSAPFRISMEAPGKGEEDIVDYRVYSNSEVVTEEDLYEVSFLEEATYFDSDGDFHLLGEVRNDSDVNLNLSMIAGLYDMNENVLDASHDDMPINSLAPGESTFYDFYSWIPIKYSEGLADQADSYIVQVDYGWTWDSDTIYADFTVTDGGFEETFWGVSFTGQVTNNSGDVLESGKVIVVLRSKDNGELLAMGYTTLYDDVPDGGTADYEAVVEVEEGFDLDSFDYTITAVGQLP